MASKYSRSKSGGINIDRLTKEIEDNTTIQTALSYIEDIDTSDNDFDLWFASSLPGAEETELDTVVIPNHVNKPLEDARSDWFRSVKNRTTTAPPSTPSPGDRYLIPSGATGGWSDHVDHIAEWNSDVWEYTDPVVCAHVGIENEEAVLHYDGVRWEETAQAIKVNFGATTDPGADDDSTESYSVGSTWVNTTKKVAWLCVDASQGAAVWKCTTVVRYKDEFTPSNGQVVFELSATPTDYANLEVCVNGSEMDDITNYTISGNTLTWLDDPFILETTDKLVVRYS
jgi:hypothetical protein